ncbi:ferritin-like domain-containing protein [Salegentibacter sp. JZCK2]|uniref:ferritin-like domain-containing protein n=1 Tax=Salegentibacter tibetensis TaxID=2873600 RepID=UPI001CC9EAE5|nr:ferritin-like domain-containing protein [Salegentibacter tibetensis]MBZ9731627.1 ferritin-like domain-containing protein [Salegentibacter tibetensis]
MKKPIINVEFADQGPDGKLTSRRRFLKTTGLLVAGSGLFMYSCSNENLEEELLTADAAADVRAGKVFNLGKGDLAILNYAYVLEQLEAEYYRQVLEGDYWLNQASPEEKEILQDLYYHEVIHRDFLKVAISSVAPPGKIAPDLIFDFSSVDFSDRTTVLTVAKILEDTGVSAYNGAGNLLENTDYLLVAGKIVSVEGRHAAAIGDLLDPGSNNFASDDVLVDLLGTGIAYDKATDPRDVLEAVAATGFLETKIIANNVPTE